MTHQTVNGALTIERTVYWSKNTGTVHPADRWLGIEEYSVSPGVREMCCLESLRGYVEARTSKTDYPRFRQQGYDCGSGPTESQCGTLTARVKGPGMRWDSDNAEALLALAALDHSRQWATYWTL